MDAVELFEKGGPIMYLLLISSIAVLAIGIERFRFYNYAIKDSEDFLNGLNARLKSQDIKTTFAYCQNENNSLGKIARAGIDAAMNRENIELALLNAHDEEAMKLRARLNYLSMIVTLAPLLGLLGTISGMIESFNIFSIHISFTFIGQLYFIPIIFFF